jgi:hypothetical protein
MIGIHPKLGGTWKEIFVYKSLRIVEIYNVLSHGRRFYRMLEYTTDVHFTHREMQPLTDDRPYPWPKWCRHGAGHPYSAYPNPLSVVIFRDATHQKNISGSQEQFIPSRLLYGLVPSALLDTHLFWQDKNDNLRGYPTDSSPHIIYVELVKVDKIGCSQLPGVCAKIRRLPRIESKQKDDSERSTLNSSRSELTGSRKSLHKKKPMDQEELLLVDLKHATPNSKLHSLAKVRFHIFKYQ